MLVKLFGSNTRVSLLKLFLLNPSEKYYIRQIARETLLPLNSVRRELNNLEKLGVLKSEIVNEKKIEESKRAKSNKERQERKYYQANLEFPLIGEIESLIVRSPILYKEAFIENLKKTGDIKVLVLTGMFTNENKAPVDLLIVGRINKIKLLEVVKSFENLLNQEINFTFMGFEEFQYRRGLTDVFLYDILGSKKIIVIDTQNII